MTRALAAAVAVVALAALSAPVAASAAAPPRTGFEQSNGASFTTHEDEVAFLAAVAAGSPRVAVTEIGRTAEGRPLHLVEIGAPGPAGREAALKRPTALVVCSQHGNEPAGREACLTLLRDLAFSQDPSLVDLLTKTTLLFVPAANPDGRAANTRENHDAIDINRDHVTLATNEARAVAAVVRDWAPDIALDLHEYGPSQPVLYDDSVLWLWPRNLNTDAAVHDLAIELGRKYLVPAANAAGYGTDEYGQQEIADNDIAQTAGDGDEGIMRNAMGLRHVLGILVETRVDADVRQDPLEVVDMAAVARRRVASHRAVLDGMLKFLRERGPEAARVTAEAAVRKEQEGRARSAPVYFGGADNQEPTAAQTVQPPPCGYQLTDAQAAMLGPRLELLGLRSFAFGPGPFVTAGQPGEPLVPLLLDARGARHVVPGTPLDSCPPDPAPAPAPIAVLPKPKAPASRCVQPRTVPLRAPRVKGRVLSTRAPAGGRRLRVRRGVAYVRLTRRGVTVKVRFTQRVRRGGRTVTVRTTRSLRVCAKRS
jgi:hypothetical protein